jgi:DNA-directed RNA polymerase II subunit RPB9
MDADAALDEAMGGADEAQATVGLRFCQLCNSMLYPKEDRLTKTLYFACLNDSYQEEAASNVVYKNNIVSVDTGINLDVIPGSIVTDPTLQRTTETNCAKCGHNEAVFIQAAASVKSKKLTLVFVCTNCRYKWCH